MGDWTSFLGYGGQLDVPANTVAAFPMMTMPDLTAYDSSLPYGGGGAQSLRDWHIDRVVGQVFRVTAQTGDPPEAFWGWRLLALPWDFQGQFFDVPWIPSDNVMLDGDYTDMVRWWAERWYHEDGTPFFGGLSPIYHPYWTFVDIHPNVLVGMHASEWPALLIDNSLNEFDLRVTHRLRGYGDSR